MPSPSGLVSATGENTGVYKFLSYSRPVFTHPPVFLPPCQRRAKRKSCCAARAPNMRGTALFLLLAHEVSAWAGCGAASHVELSHTEQTRWLSKLRVYVISPPQLDERFHTVHRQLLGLGINESRIRRVFSASARALARYDVCRANDQKFSSHKSSSDLSFVQSAQTGMPWKTLNLIYNQVETWNWVALEGGPGLVLEDDVVLDDRLPAALAHALSTLDSCEPTWDVLWPGYCCCAPNGPSVSRHLAQHSQTGCAQSYILSATGAERLLRHLPMPQCLPADLMMNQLFQKVGGWKGFALKQSLINQRDTKVTTHRFSNEELVSWTASGERPPPKSQPQPQPQPGPQSPSQPRSHVQATTASHGDRPHAGTGTVRHAAHEGLFSSLSSVARSHSKAAPPTQRQLELHGGVRHVGDRMPLLNVSDPYQACEVGKPRATPRAVEPYNCPRRLRMCFLDWALDGRGMPASTFSYASHAESVLGHEVVILAGSITECKGTPRAQCRPDLRSDRTKQTAYSPSSLQRWCRHFPVRFFKGLVELPGAAQDAGCDSVYLQINSASPHPAVQALQEAGHKVLVHCMGWCKFKQGDAYAVISEWAMNRFHTGPVVRYPVSACPAADAAAALALRATHSIPSDAPLLCYLGGPDSFDLGWVVDRVFGSYAIVDGWLSKMPTLHLLFMPGNPKLPQHPRIHFNPASTDLAAKGAFLHTCDAMLHARSNGESFGMAIAEFSVCNKPVITQGRVASEPGYETAHLDMLGSKAWTYQKGSPESLFAQIKRLVDTPREVLQRGDWNAHESNRPSILMRQSFHPKFIDPLGLCK